MKTLYQIARWIMIVVLVAIIAVFGWIFISSLLNIFILGPDVHSIILLLFGGGVAAFSIWRLCMYLKKKTSFDKRQEKYQKHISLNNIMRIDKACPTCGSRLAVCEKNGNSNIICLNVTDHSVENEYYCPCCDRRFDISENFQRFVPVERDLPEQSGKCYFIQKSVHKKLLWAFMGIALIGILSGFIAVRFVMMYMQFQNALTYGVVFFGLISFAGLYFAYQLYNRWRESTLLCFEIIDDGLVVHEKGVKHFYGWEDFRIVTLVPDFMKRGDAYIFDIKQRVLMIDYGLERHRDFAYDIIDHVRQIARVDFRL